MQSLASTGENPQVVLLIVYAQIMTTVLMLMNASFTQTIEIMMTVMICMFLPWINNQAPEFSMVSIWLEIHQ